MHFVFRSRQDLRGWIPEFFTQSKKSKGADARIEMAFSASFYVI